MLAKHLDEPASHSFGLAGVFLHLGIVGSTALSMSGGSMVRDFLQRLVGRIFRQDPVSESSSSNSDSSICVVAYNAYPLVDSTSKALFGGLETSAWLTAKALAAASCRPVYLLVQTLLPRRSFTHSGVTVLPMWRPLELTRRSVDGYVTVTSRFPFVEITRFKWALLWQVPFLCVARLLRRLVSRGGQVDRFFDKLPGDVFLSFGVHSVSASIVQQAERLGKISIVSVQSNASLDPRIMSDPAFIDGYGETAESCRIALQRANCVFVQSTAQCRQLKAVFGIEGTLLENPFDFEDWLKLAGSCELPSEIVEGRFVLWIGRADRIHKRPFALLEVAAMCPGISFLMILNDGEDEVKREVMARAPGNVRIVHRVPFHQMPAVFHNAAEYISTGTELHEGFPNVLLQAAASKVPVLSLDFLPQEIVEKEFGFVAGSTVELARRTQEIWDHSGCVSGEVERGFAFAKSFRSPREYGIQILSVISSLQCPQMTR